MKRFEYSDYEFNIRSLPRIGVYDKYVHLFDGAHRILDVGCGRGLFLSAMVAARGDQAEAIGVDSDERVTQYAQAQGLNVICSPGVEYLLSHPEHFDGVFCAHVVEHLVFDSVIDLIEAIALALRPGGILVMLFPNPESLEMQLSHFWKDPGHVRFYHGELVVGILRHYQFTIDQCTDITTWRDDTLRPSGLGRPPDPSRLRRLLSRFAAAVGLAKSPARMRNRRDELYSLDMLRKTGNEVLIVAHKHAVSNTP